MQDKLQNLSNIEFENNTLFKNITLNESIFFILNDKSRLIVVPSLIEGIKLQKILNLNHIENELINDSFFQSNFIINNNNNLVKMLTDLKQKCKKTYICLPSILSLKLFDPDMINYGRIKFNVGSTSNLNNIKNQLINAGYFMTDDISGEKEFSVKGENILIYKSDSEIVKLELCYNQIESIKLINTNNYSLIKNLNLFEISHHDLGVFIKDKQALINKVLKLRTDECIPDFVKLKIQKFLDNSTEHKLSEEVNYFYNLIDEFKYNVLDFCDNFVLLSPLKTMSNFIHQKSDDEDAVNELLSLGQVVKQLVSKENLIIDFKKYTNVVIFSPNNTSNDLIDDSKYIDFGILPFQFFLNNISEIKQELINKIKQGFEIYFCDNITKDMVETVLNNCDLTNYFNKQIFISKVKFESSFVITSHKILVLGAITSNNRIKKDNIQKNKVFYLPKIGDYVVHSLHGIGKCEKIERMKFGNSERDYFVILYDKGDKLYLPSEQIDQISAYVGSNENIKLNRLGGEQFEKIKSKVRENIKELAFDLVKLYGERQKQKGIVYPPDSYLQQEFENNFEYEETTDQIQALKEIKNDLENGKVMDRLLVGDVGYGKSEVAYRTAFKVISSGGQVMLLAPTSILAQQHYSVAKKRMEPFFVHIEQLSKLVPRTKQKEIIENFNNGKIDFLIGTHAILNDKLLASKLQLLILDEEQKFGVGQKEKLKLIRKNLNVLSLSATPIPRSLHMSVVGIRDISTLSTPPKNRVPIKTLVCKLTDEIIEKSINREMDRGGQVIVLYNRVADIEKIKERIVRLVPNARVLVGHGQMDSTQLKKVIEKVYDGEADVFVCTTIVENGVDISNANTIIVIEADKLGLSTLYQIRGRVGRSDKQAFAYLTYNSSDMLTSSAFDRLEAMQSYSDLGSGFKVAMRDLEIRGAGNVLGKEQHGHMDKVGYEMYCNILNEVISELRGEKQDDVVRVLMDIRVKAYIPQDYITNESDRIKTYNHISQVISDEDVLNEKKGLEAIYGTMPLELENLINVAQIKNLSSKLNISKITISETKCEIKFYDDMSVFLPILQQAMSKINQDTVLKFEGVAIIDMRINNNILSNIELVKKFIKILYKLKFGQ